MSTSRPQIILAALLLTATAASAQTLTGRASVIDGDTIEIHGTRIRLAGIDAPESRQICHHLPGGEPFRCGQTAALYLSDMIGTRPVSCATMGRDKYRRTLARCTVAGEDIGAAMVRAGWALPYMRPGKTYRDEEHAAKATRSGLWSTRFKKPREWRNKNLPRPN